MLVKKKTAPYIDFFFDDTVPLNCAEEFSSTSQLGRLFQSCTTLWVKNLAPASTWLTTQSSFYLVTALPICCWLPNPTGALETPGLAHGKSYSIWLYRPEEGVLSPKTDQVLRVYHHILCYRAQWHCASKAFELPPTFSGPVHSRCSKAGLIFKNRMNVCFQYVDQEWWNLADNIGSISESCERFLQLLPQH